MNISASIFSSIALNFVFAANVLKTRLFATVLSFITRVRLARYLRRTCVSSCVSSIAEPRADAHDTDTLCAFCDKRSFFFAAELCGAAVSVFRPSAATPATLLFGCCASRLGTARYCRWWSHQPPHSPVLHAGKRAQDSS